MSRAVCAAVFIARDEERCIGRAIASVVDAVDRVVVLDTGSRDDTVAVATAAGGEVAQFSWCDDFSAARNAALELSDADLNLVIDADEWLVAGQDWLRDGEPAFHRVGLASVRSTSVADGQHVETSTVSERLLPRSVRYVGAVHEQPEHGMGVVETPLVLGHDGYEADQMRRKTGRNERLLRSELERRPADAYLTYQLGKELQASRRFEESAELYLMALALAPSDALWRHPLAVRALSVLGKTGRFAEALELIDAEGPSWVRSPDWFFALGNLFLDLAVANPSTAPEALPLVEGAWLRCLEIGERPDLPGAVAGRGSRLAAHNLAGFYESRGDRPAAQRYRTLSTG